MQSHFKAFLRFLKETNKRFITRQFPTVSFRYLHVLRTKLDMEKVYLRQSEDGEKININFRYNNQELRIDREFNFCRNFNEKIDDALSRIRNNVEKELNKRTKKGKKKSPAQVPEPLPAGIQIDGEIPIEFLREGSKVSDITFAELLTPDVQKKLQLRVIDRNFAVAYNEPWVVNLVLPTCILAGCMVYPSKVEMQYALKEHSLSAWFKAKMPPSGDLLRGAEWAHCGDGFFYSCKNEDVGYHLKFVLTPGNSNDCFGPPVENISKNEVQASPGLCPFETRHCFTQTRLSGDIFRVVSYNILADLYADSDYTRTHLFPYCPPYALKMEYRKQLFLKELLGYNADIMCLQEVDLKMFDIDLKTVLETPETSFRGVMAQKGTCGEGVAMYYRTDRFDLLETKILNIGEAISNLSELAELSEKIRKNELLWQRICDRSTTLQVTLLKSKENENYILLANTHLYFHPDADHIRLLQFGFSMRYLEHFQRKVLKDLGFGPQDEHRLSIIFCGDFNSVPECGIYKLMTQGFVDKDFIDWSSNVEEAVKNVTLSQPFEMKSACGTPAYTNFTHAFAACLDYIFYQSDRLTVEQVIPLPTEEELRTHIAIPSVVFPSDHVALVADLKFKTN